MPENTNARLLAARAFVRSLNILLKFARLYDFGHPRTAKQYETAWSELRTALGSDNESGLLLAISGEQLLLDGTPLESAAAERSFARMLSAAGIASIHFSPHVTQQSLERLVRGFPTNTGSKPGQLAAQLKATLDGDPNIHVNEICFVPADSAVARSTVAAQLAAHTMGFGSSETDELLKDPEKLLQLILASEGARGMRGTNAPGFDSSQPTGPSGSAPLVDSMLRDSEAPALAEAHARTQEGGVGPWSSAFSGNRANRPAAGAPGTITLETGLITLQESELQGILHVLAQIGRSGAAKEKLDVNDFQSQVSALPRRARFTLTQALSALAAQAPAEETEKPALMRLAEHVAVRFALESYERGDVKVNAVRDMLQEMNQELDGLRKIVGAYEETMTRAGLPIQSHVETLADQFWSKVPSERMKLILASKEAWCIPPGKVRAYVDTLVSTSQGLEAEEVLRNYAAGIRSPEADIRRQSAIGVAELAATYAKGDGKLLVNVIRDAGLQLAEEHDAELQSLVSAAFVRLSQEALQARSYPAIQRSVELMEYMDAERPGTGKIVRPRIAVESRVGEFIEESVRTRKFSSDLRLFLRRLPLPAAEQIARRFGRSGFREDCDLLVLMMDALGNEALEHLREQLRKGEASEAIDVIGILARLDLPSVEQVLPDRMKDWKRSAHDRVVRQIANSGIAERGRVLLSLFDSLDVLVRPLAIDEIGMGGGHLDDMRLLRIADGELPMGSTDYLRLKAIEALGRLRSDKAATILRKVVEERKAWRWAQPAELRIAAAQALQGIDPEWLRDFLPRSGLKDAELALEPLGSDPESSAIRQRRYPRLRLERPLPAMTMNLKDNFRLQIPEIAFGGGVAMSEQSLYPGSVVELRLNPSDGSVKAQAIVRDANTQARAFELVDIDMEERAKLRKLLQKIGNMTKNPTSQQRKRAGVRTILSGGKETK